MKVYYDYSDTASVTKTFDIDSITQTDTEDYAWEWHSGKKCKAVRFEIYDSSHTGSGRSFELTNINMEIGIKGSMYKNFPSHKSL